MHMKRGTSREFIEKTLIREPMTHQSCHVCSVIYSKHQGNPNGLLQPTNRFKFRGNSFTCSVTWYRFQNDNVGKHDLKYNKLDEIRKSVVSYSSNQGQSWRCLITDKECIHSPHKVYWSVVHVLINILAKKPEIHISNRRENLHGFHTRGIPSERNKIYVNSLLYTWVTVLDPNFVRLGSNMPRLKKNNHHCKPCNKTAKDGWCRKQQVYCSSPSHEAWVHY